MSSKHTAWAAAAQIKFISALRSKLEAQAHDEETIRDTIEGCVDLDSIMNALLRDKLDSEALVTSYKAVAKEWTERAYAKSERAESISAIILQALQESGQESWKGDMGSVGLRDGGLSVEITDGSVLPLIYSKFAPDVAAVRSTLLSIEEKRQAILGDTGTDIYSKLDQLAELLFSSRDAYAAWMAVEPQSEITDENDLLGALATYDPIPGARLVRGDQTISFRKPTAKSRKAA